MINNINWLVKKITFDAVGYNHATLTSSLSEELKENNKGSLSTLLHCNVNVLEQLVDYVLLFIKSDDKRCYLNLLHITFQIRVVPQNLDRFYYIEGININELNNRWIQLRDILKTIYDIFGAELEFSGRGVSERGVIIDYDETNFFFQKLESNKIRLGNTVIKINEQQFNEISLFLKSEIADEYRIDSDNKIISFIKNLTKSKLYNLLSISDI